jgi:oligopeptide transport system substrate-binding protein
MKASAVPFLYFAALVLAGCTRRETAVEAGIRTHTLLIGNGAEPASLDPHVVNLYFDVRILLTLFEGLTAIDPTTALPVPAVAERWDISPDGLVYTFHLRPTARWSNGDPVTASDFAYTIQRMLLPRFGAPNAYLLYAIKNAETFNKGNLTDFAAVGVEVVDSLTLRLTLERPTPYLLALAAHMWFPVHRQTIEKFGRADDRSSAWTRPGNLVGNGPFTLTEWRPNERIVVTKNPHYWDAARNRLDRIVFFPTESPDVEERNFRTGQVHVTNALPMSKIAAYRDRDQASLRIDPFLGTSYFAFNVSRPPLDHFKVRRALSLAIDREGIVRTAFASSYLPAACLVPQGCGGYMAKVKVQTDFTAARRLLEEAGYPGGKGLPVMAVQLGINNSDWTKAVEVIQETWRRELGVSIVLEPLDQKTWLQNQQTHNYAISFAGWFADFADPASFLEVFLSHGSNNWTGWANPDFDRLITEAARTLDPTRRFKLFQQAETLLLEEAPISPLYFNAQTYLLHPAVKNWESAPLGYHRYQNVRLEK